MTAQALIVGGGRAAGVVAAKVLGPLKGYDLHLVDEDEDGLEAAADEIVAALTPEKPIEVETEALSLKHWVNVDALALGCYGAKVLVTALGLLPRGNFDDVAPDGWQDAWDRGVRTAMDVSRAVAENMAEDGGGHIVLLYRPAENRDVYARAGWQALAAFAEDLSRLPGIVALSLPADPRTLKDSLTALIPAAPSGGDDFLG